MANIEKIETKNIKIECTHRESNPGQVLGRHLCYHYTTGADCWGVEAIKHPCTTVSTNTVPKEMSFLQVQCTNSGSIRF